MNEQLIRNIVREELRLLLSGGIVVSHEPTGTEDLPEASENMFANVTSTLHLLGIKPSIKGFRYIRDAVLLVCDDIEMLGGITTKLYPAIAKSYHTTPSRVERAIRHAIEVAFGNNNESISRMFGNMLRHDKYKPTNSDFIAMIAEKLNVERKVS